MKKIMDIFSYVHSDVLSVEDIEQAFIGTDDSGKFSIGFSYQTQVSNKNMQEAVNELLSEDRKVAIVKMNGKEVAVIGFIEE